MRTAFILSLVVVSVASQGAQAQNLDTTTFVVMGEGLAAGMANYGLSSVMQSKDFPLLVATQMGTVLEQPLIQPPGIGDVVGYPGQEVIVQRYPQGSVRQFYYPTDPTKAPIQTPPIFVTNVSVPGLTLNDAVTMVPVAPVVQRANMKQTVFNMILGFPQLILDNIPSWTQLQYAEELFPTVAMVELGYYEALTAAVAGDASQMPDPAAFGKTYGTVVAGLRGLQSQVIVTTIPNPLDTAYFNSLLSAASIVQAAPSVLSVDLGISAQDYVTRNGLEQIVNDIAAYEATFPLHIASLPAGSTLSAATAAALTNNVNALNAQIVSVAKANGAVVYDLNAFLHKIKVAGASTGTGTVTGDYLGGFYSLDGVYPSATGHALIANDILNFLNQTYHRTFPLVNVSAVAASDPATQLKVPTGGGVFTPNLVGPRGIGNRNTHQ
ncbi:MAG TPA: SGNH/GDSL hydrolase family protein [Bryobacteraceae bacterium]|nr:SGNH/GDSL hydrolase family protein [Bryobacteraceae bacterium]